MTNVRRWYMYIVCSVSLQAVTWAIIELLRNLFIFGINPTAVAFQVAVIVIGLPVFLAHWLWARRLAAQSIDERGATLRRLYLYGNMAGFLAPFVANAFGLIRLVVGGPGENLSYETAQLLQVDAIIFHILALIILAGMWFYHRQVTAEDSDLIPEMGSSATIRRLYVLGFSAAGLIMTTLGVIGLIRWLILNLSGDVIQGIRMDVFLKNEITRLVVGVPLWVIFWTWGQRMFYQGSEEERSSALHKLYLYAAVLAGVVSVVSNAAGILASLLRRLLDLAPSDGNQQPLPVLIAGGVLWAYHAFVLRGETSVAPEAPRQAGVRRLYLYLVAAVGLVALLGGLGGLFNLILQVLFAKEMDVVTIREQFTWFLAAVLVGLPVWIIPWRPAQNAALLSGSAGADERRSVVRKIYLYFFMLVATLALLSSAVYIVYRLFSTLLGEAAPGLAELGYAISASVIAFGVWVYHASSLRNDAHFARQEKTSLLESLQVVVVSTEGDSFASQVVDHLRRDFPGISLEPIHLDKLGVKQGEHGSDLDAIAEKLGGAGMIIGPWGIAVSNGGVDDRLVQAVISSPARKLLLPLSTEGWDWIGVDRWELEAMVSQTVRAVKQVLAGEEVRASRPLGAGAVIGIIFIVLLVLIPMVIALVNFLY